METNILKIWNKLVKYQALKICKASHLDLDDTLFGWKYFQSSLHFKNIAFIAHFITVRNDPSWTSRKLLLIEIKSI